MILQNISGRYQVMCGNLVRKMRTIVVPDGKYDESIWKRLDKPQPKPKNIRRKR